MRTAGTTRRAGLAACAFAAVRLALGDGATSDHEREDRRYLERRASRAEKPASEAPADPAAGARDFLARADELIRDRSYRSAASDRHRVQTDDPRVDPKAVVALLDGFSAFFERQWSGRADLAPEVGQLRVFLFYSSRDLELAIGPDAGFAADRAAGHHRPAAEAVAAHTDPEGPPKLGETLIHAVAHRLVERRLPGGRAPRSPWVGEGLASYFGHTRIARGIVFDAGVVGGSAVALVEGVGSEPPAQARSLLDELRNELRSRAKGGDPLFSDVLRIEDAAEFYGEDAELHRAASWVIAHYLLHADDGSHAAAFGRWLALEERAEGGPDALLRELGVDAVAFEVALAEHLRRMSPR